MAGPNKPPREGSREQLERDNETYLYNEKPFSEQGGTVGEAEADIPGLDDALEAAMKDADPQAYAQGLREDATISTSRVFAAGSLIAALGRDNATPQTRQESTYASTDTGIYGHADSGEVLKQRDILNESTKLDSDGVPVSDGKINTIYSATRLEQGIEEKRRKEEEERATMYAIMNAIDNAEDAWMSATMTFEELEEAVQNYAQQSQTVVQRAAQVSDNVSRFIDENRVSQQRMQGMVTTVDQMRADIQAQLAAAPDDATRAQLQARLNLLEDTGAAVSAGNQAVGQRGAALEQFMLENDLNIRNTQQRSERLQERLEEVRNMTGDEAKAAMLERQTQRLEQMRELPQTPETARAIAEIERRIQQTQRMTGDQAKEALQARLEQNLAHAQEDLERFRLRSEALDGMTESFRDYERASLDYNQYLLDAQRDGVVSPEESAELQRRMTELRQKHEQIDAQLQNYQTQARQASHDHARAAGTNTNLDAEQAREAQAEGQAADATVQAAGDARLAETRAIIAARLAQGRIADHVAGEPGLQPTVRPIPQERQSSLEILADKVAAAKVAGRTLTDAEIMELRALPQIGRRDISAAAQSVDMDLSRSPAMQRNGPTSPSTDAALGGPISSTGPARESSFNLFGPNAFNRTQVPYSPIVTSGYSNASFVNDFGISGGNYSSFAESEEFHRHDAPTTELAGLTPSYNKPWYETAWTATTDFMSSMFGGQNKTTAPTIDSLGQQPGIMLASADPNANRINPVAGTGAGGGAMA